MLWTVNRSRVGKYQKQTWKKSGLYKYMHGWILEIQGDELQDLAMCALLYDNALTQYISEELKKDSVINCKKVLLILIFPGKLGNVWVESNIKNEKI